MHQHNKGCLNSTTHLYETFICRELCNFCLQHFQSEAIHLSTGLHGDCENHNYNYFK